MKKFVFALTDAPYAPAAREGVGVASVALECSIPQHGGLELAELEYFVSQGRPSKTRL